MNTDLLADIGHAAEGVGNYTLARQSFERGAELGDVTCLERLADMYDEGRGVLVDKPEAMRLYRQAWRRHRSALAANNLAILYREKGDWRAMFRWFERAASTGDGSPMVEMAKCYLSGRGVRRSEQKALRCLAAAIASDDIFECDREEAEALLEGMRPRAL